MAQFVDWDLAAATAAALGKSGPAVSYEEAADAVADLKELADEAVQHVTAFTGMQAQVIAPPVRVVDRRDWAATNIDGLRQVINPLADRLTAGNTPGPLTAAIGSRFTGVQAGTVLAYLSGKVLGQYEVFTANPGQLLLVAPNIVEAERRLGADPRDFRLWVCLHEVTHRVQFTAVAWMRGYFLGEVQAFVDASQLNQDQLFERVRRGVTALAEAVRDPESRVSVLDLVQTPGQRAVLDRLTALMTLLEGHAEFVMDGVGPEVIPSVEDIRAKFNRRRETANPIERVVRKLLGIEAKMRQYGEGRKFVHGVVDRVGMSGFNRIWDSPLTLPRLDELADPDAWVNRVHGPNAYRQVERPPAATVPASGGPVAVPDPGPAASVPASAGAAVAVEEPAMVVEEPAVVVEEHAGVAEPSVGVADEATATATAADPTDDGAAAPVGETAAVIDTGEESAPGGLADRAPADPTEPAGAEGSTSAGTDAEKSEPHLNNPETD